MKAILCGIKRMLAMSVLTGILYTCTQLTSSYKQPVEIECPTATDRLGKTIPAYMRVEKVGVYMIRHCDGTIRLDTVKEVQPKIK